MKIIISENQELKAKKKVIFFLLDKQKYNLVEIENIRIYFTKKIGDKRAEIRYDKDDGWCGISYDLIKFFSSITGFEESEVQELISKWVEHALQMEVKYKVRYPTKTYMLVEHALQMEVKYNASIQGYFGSC